MHEALDRLKRTSALTAGGGAGRDGIHFVFATRLPTGINTGGGICFLGLFRCLVTPFSHTHARASGHSRTPLHPRGPRRGTRRTNRTRTRRRSATSRGNPAPRARACVHSGRRVRRRHPARFGARPVQPRVAAGIARVGALLGRVEQVHGGDAALDEPVRGGGADLSVEEDERVARRRALHTSDSVATPGCEQRLCCWARACVSL